ncbi:MAG TPA: hypothetical protein VK453_19130 [Micromonosporaceae bacterium]|nr:hypothetical protein [Micromonosporaceae bacterium]
MRAFALRLLHLLDRYVAEHPDARWTRVRLRSVVAAMLGFALLCGAMLAGAGNPAVARQYQLSFVRQPTPYTELFFADPEQLPTESGNAKPTEFLFVVRNREGKAVEYRYVSRIVRAGTPMEIGRGSFVLSNGQTATRAVLMPATRSGERFVVSVALVDRPEVINFIGGST